MKVVILAGGKGSRLGGGVDAKPKPLVEVGGKPMLWHICKIFSAFGLNEFVICLGFKGDMIKEYFANYLLHNSDVTMDLETGVATYHREKSEAWKVTLIDTGLDTETGGRLRRVREYIKDDTFCMTYGDGVSDLDISALIDFHFGHKKSATVTAIQPPGRFGQFRLVDNRVTDFEEKPETGSNWINGGFFVLEPSVLDLIEDDSTLWERQPMSVLTDRNELMAYQHTGFWHCLDTMRDKHELETMWNGGNPAWKLWSD